MSSPSAPPPAAQLSPSDAVRSNDRRSFTFIVEHLDPELGPWSALEYQTIARECRESGNAFILSSVPDALVESGGLDGIFGEGMGVERKGVEELFPLKGRGVEGGESWIGKGIDGGDGARMGRERKICLLDPQAERELSPGDGEVFRGFLFGGILGDDPPRDRTSDLRRKGYEGRRLGPKQMTTDTAVRVTRTVVQDEVPLDRIPYIDFPELKLDDHESTQMPFRYVKRDDGKPVMPEGMLELIKEDADKGFDDFLGADTDD